MSDNLIPDANPLLHGGLHLLANHGSCTIHNADTSGNVDGEKVAEIRAWGYLTGRGALKLSAEEAARHQDELGRLFVAAPDLLALAQDLVADYERPFAQRGKLSELVARAKVVLAALNAPGATEDEAGI